MDRALNRDDYLGYFAVYDGHAGSTCADYLEHNLHCALFNQKALFKYASLSFDTL